MRLILGNQYRGGENLSSRRLLPLASIGFIIESIVRKLNKGLMVFTKDGVNVLLFKRGEKRYFFV